MERKYKIKHAIFMTFKSGDHITTKEIINTVSKKYPDMPVSSILPSDFCINHKNKDPFSGKNHLFERMERGKYKLL